MDGSFFERLVGRKAKGPHLERRLNAAFVRTAPPGRHTDGGSQGGLSRSSQRFEDGGCDDGEGTAF